MILKLLIDLIFSILVFLLELLPPASALPVAVSTAFETFATYFSMINSFFPVDTVFTILIYVLLFEGAILIFKLITFVFDKVRGSG